MSDRVYNSGSEIVRFKGTTALDESEVVRSKGATALGKIGSGLFRRGISFG